MKTLGILALVLVTLGGGQEGGRERGLLAFTAPTYPHVARIANAQGDVRLLAKISPDGRICEVKVISGNPALSGYARENLLTWVLTPAPEDAELDFVFSFRLVPPRVYHDLPPKVVLISPTHVTITTNIPLPTGGPERLRRRR
jgi:hypothetical protein